MVDKNEPRVKALAFAKRGYSVLALHGITKRDGKLCCTCGDTLCTSPGKHPHPRLAPHGKDSATTDLDAVRSWFAEPHSWINYGIRTDPFTVIDIDPRNGGAYAWQKLIRENYDVHTWRVITGSGGQHIIFAAAEPPVSSGKIVRGVDVKAVGGYIVGVGCRHISGNDYKWFPHCRPSEVELKAPPPWVIKKLRSPKSAGAEPRSNGKPREFYNTLLEPALPGERHDRVASLIGHLFGSAFPDRGVLLSLVISHVRLTYPDLGGFNDDEIIEIARGIAKCERKKREVA